MAAFSVLHTDFSAGLLSPLMRGRNDLDRYRSGLQKCENFLPTIQGPLKYREGFRFVTTAPSGNTKQIPFQVGDSNRYMVLLSAGRIDVYSPSGSLVIGLTGVPYQSEEIPDVRYHQSVDQIIFTHPSYEPHELISDVVYTATGLQDIAGNNLLDVDGFFLQSTSNNTESPDAWSFGPVTFFSHPYEEAKSTGTQLKMYDNKEVVRLTSTDPTDFLWTDTEIAAMNTFAGSMYVEYNINNQWGLARVLTTAANEYGVSAPQNPLGTTCYVDPVDQIINVGDTSTKVAYISSGNSWSSYNPDLPYVKRPESNTGVEPSGGLVSHLRSDTLLWQSNHAGAWFRLGPDNLFRQVIDPSTSTRNFTGLDEVVRWFRVDTLLGLQDHPVEFVYGNPSSYKLQNGSVYSVYDWGSANAGTLTTYTTPDVDNNAVLSKIDIGARQSSALFTAGAHSQGSNVSSWSNFILGNLSTAKQFDVAESGLWYGGDRLRQPKGVVRLYDLTTDPEELATHTITVSSNKDTFEVGRDVGRFILVKLNTDWVTLKITEVVSPTLVQCDVLSNIPYDKTVRIYGIQNGGVSTEFRMGAWYNDNWPRTVSYYERRRVYGGSNKEPNNVWFSKINNPIDFRTIEEDGTVLDTTGITYPLGSSSSVIRWLLTGPTLVVGTESGEWQIRPNEFQSAVTTENIRITEETSVGSVTQGQRIGSAAFFASSSGKIFSEFTYELQQQRFVTKTTTKLVEDLFIGDGLVSFAYQQSPNSVIWCLTEQGRLVSLTYRQEDDYYAWSTHSTSDGVFTDVQTLIKGSDNTKEDQLWVVVDRNGSKSLEIMGDSFYDTESDNIKGNMAFFDSYVRYPETGYESQATIPAPAHLAAYEELPLVVDGVYLGLRPVVDGLVTLPEGVSCLYYALVGIRYNGLAQPMPLAFDGPSGPVYGEEIKLLDFRVYVHESMGYDLELHGELDQVRAQNGDVMPMGESPRLYTGFMDTHRPSTAQFDVDNSPIIRQTEPYPLTLVSMKYKISQY